jgi:peptidyl-prolyl cis-trans isomerase D
MSVIQNLRTKYAKVVGGLIGVSLIGFILMDASNGPLRSLFGNDTSVATVNGDKIDAKDYQQRINDYELLVPLYSKGQPMDENTRMQIRQQVLDEMVYEKLVEDNMEKLGIQVTDAELKDLTHGNTPDPMVQQFPYFQDQQNGGGFNPQYIAAFEKQVPQIPDANQREQLTKSWDALQRFVARGRRIQKYNALVMNGVNFPRFIGDRTANDAASFASVRFVKIPYTTVPDAEVKVTDEDLNDYVSKHKAQFTSDQPSRSIDYVSFDVLPSHEDTMQSLGALQAVQAQFASASDPTAIVNRNSDVPYVEKYYNKKTFPSAMADSILSRPVGTVVGPFYEGGAYQMIKVLDRKEMPDSVKAQHILVAANANRDDSAAHRLIDSIKMMAASGTSFDSLAKKYSDDPSNKDKGGDLGTFAQGMMVPEFNDAAFNGKAGDLKTVKTQFGWHLLKIGEQKNFQPATKLAVIVKGLQPSQSTNEAAYSKALEFAGKNGEGKAFDAAVTKNGLQKRVAERVKVSDQQITGLGSARDIVRWMWDKKTDVGAVSSPFNLEGRYVVAKLSGTQEAGLMKLDMTTRPQIEAIVKAQKKGDLLAKRYANVKTLDAASAQSKQPIQSADSFSLANAFAPTIGFEPKVVGYAFYQGLKQGATSPAIKGADGLFFIAPTARFTKPMDPSQAEQQRMMVAMQTRNSMGQAIQEAARKGASIKYNARNF